MIALFLFLFFSTNLHAENAEGSISVIVKNLRSDEGTTQLLLFNSDKGFPSVSKEAIRDGHAKIKKGKSFFVWKKIPYGTYAISVLHDENNNEKLDTNFMGIPREGLGASQGIKSMLRKPEYEESSFNLSTDDLLIEVDMRYF